MYTETKKITFGQLSDSCVNRDEIVGSCCKASWCNLIKIDLCSVDICPRWKELKSSKD